MQLPSSIKLLFVLAILFLSSCRTPQDLVFRDFNNLALDKLGFSASVLKVDLIYYNPNNFGMELKRTELDIYVDGTFLGHSNQELQVAIPKRDVFTIPIKLDLDMKNLFKNGLTSLFKKTVNVRAVGNIKVGKAGVYKNFNIDYTSQQQIPLF
ncbi:MAG: LEA type 2 family protein [Ferruginibacter sp.]